MPIPVHSDTDRLQRRNHELSILNTIAQALNRETDLSKALNTALSHVANLFDLRTGWVWLLREDTGEAYLAVAQNLPPALANAPHRMEGHCYCLDTFSAGDLNGAANVNVVTCTRLRWLADGTDGLRHHASIPLYAHGKQLGVLNVASPDWRELSPDDLRLLYTIGDMVSIAIERARLFERSMQLGVVEERNRLAREIHDTLAQGLAAIALQLETADALLETETSLDKARATVQRGLDLARKNLEEARRSVLDLRASPLEGRSLADALTALAQEWAAKDSLHLTLRIVGRHQPLPLRVEIELYRIAQEAMMNVVRHARAQTVTVQLVLTPDQAQMVIADDGQGFDPAQVPQGHYGLIGMNERARLLGGQLILESCPDEGTRIEIVLPRDSIL